MKVRLEPDNQARFDQLLAEAIAAPQITNIQSDSNLLVITFDITLE